MTSLIRSSLNSAVSVCLSRAMALGLVLTLALFAACRTGAPEASDTSPVMRASHGTDLVGRPDATNFNVTFKWTGAESGRDGWFVWRQGSDNRRWDSFLNGLKQLKGGDFSLEQGFARSGNTSALDVTGCHWFAPMDGNVKMFCGKGDAGGELEIGLRFLDFGTVTQVLPTREIAGRHADCYALGGGQPLSTLCVDLATRVPLKFQVLKSGRVTESIEAVTISEDDTSFVPTTALPVNADIGSEALFPISDLRLPSTAGVN